ncbi:hypothetical protein C2R22_13480 [Salinigranum rubrum]|uniref:Uncharacterized protein n=1 Tax=Salinigranum rubrum TaxID=755307 RepID=A0A2I8VKS1_9EURY|nr:flippase [Salinigranum rubrum]AUV82526.1 hypothetical protein C2R22_13480 [Salinigranum rubrum]
MTIRQKISGSIFEQASISFTGRILGRTADYGLTAFLAAVLGPESLGEFAFVLILLRFASLIGRLGMGTVGQRYVTILDGDDLGEYVALSICIPLVIGTVTGIAVFFLLVYSGRPLGENPAIVLVLVTPLLALSETLSGIAEGLKRVEISVYVREVGIYILGLVFVAIAVWLDGGLMGVAIAYGVAISMSNIIGIYLLSSYLPFPRVPALDSSRELIKYGIYAGTEKVANKLTGWTDILMLGALVTSASVGLYQLSFQTAALLSFAIVSVNSIFPSVASGMFNDGRVDHLESLYQTTTKWIFYLTLLGGVWLISWSPVILGVFGAEFVDARIPFVIIVVGQLIGALVGPAGYLLLMTDHERLQATNAITAAVINVVLNYVLILEYGIVGAAVATTISISLLNLVRLIEVKYVLGFWPYSKSYIGLLPALFLGGLISSGSTLVLPNTVPFALISGVAAVSVFLLLALNRVTANDLFLIESLR